MTLRLLDHAEAWALEAKVKLNAALTYLDGLQAAITAEIAAAIAAAVVDATTTVKGIVELATDAEAVAVTDTTRALTPSNFSGKAGQQTYVEGTFTPAITFGGAAVGITYAAQTGVYTRIGRVVQVDINIVLTAKGSSTGSVVVTGLPLAVASTRPLSLAIDNMTAGVGDTVVQCEAVGGGTTVALRDIAAGVTAALTDADFTDTSVIRVCGVYRTSA